MQNASRFALSVCLLAAAAPTLAAEVTGQIVDPATGTALPGAIVKVQGTERSVVADARGQFSIRDLPEAGATLIVSYVGYPDTTRQVSPGAPATITLEPILAEADIVVTGSRAAERRALQAKRASLVIQDTLNSNDVGKLPDQNVAEAVRRLPGVSVANDQGEGRYVIIRGGNPNLANVTLNGQTAPAPEPESRQVKLDDVPSSLIGSVDVVKTLTADRDANAIAGQVDINTLSAFDRPRTFAYGRAATGVNNLNGRSPFEGEATVGSTFGDRRFGIVVAGNYSTRPIASENNQGSANWVVNGSTGGVTVPDDFRLRDYNLTRKRYGAVVNLDWHPTPNIQLFARGIYSKFKDSETRDQFRVEIPTGSAFGVTPVVASFLTGATTTGGSFSRARGTRFIRFRNEDSDTLTFQGGGRFDLGPIHLDTEITYARAKKTDPLRSEFQFRSSSTAFAGTYDISNNSVNVALTAPAYNAAIYPFRSFNLDTRRAIEDLWQGRFDLTIPVAVLGDDSSIKLGAKYLHRHKTNNRDFQNFLAGAGTFSLASIANVDPLYLYRGRFQFGPRVPYSAGVAFLAANPTASIYDAAGSIGNSLVADYDITEKIYAGYAMATLKFGQVTLIPGVRVERTEGRYSAKRITATSTVADGFNVFGNSSYTDVFPGINARWDAFDRLVLRGAVTTAIGRPDYNQLAPTVAVDTGANTVTLGNANLRPLKSTNYDASAEYYLPGQGIVSVAGFYKDIRSPIYTQGSIASGTFGGVALTNALVTQPINATSARIYGVEVNLQAQFTFLPAPFDGLGIGVNYTRTEGQARGVSGRAGDVPLFLQSKNVFNAQLFYEKGRVAMRVAYSRRSAYLDTLGVNAATDQFTDANGQLDLRGSFEIIKQVTLYAEATNVTNAPWRRYVGFRNQLIENEQYSYTVKGGVQVAF